MARLVVLYVLYVLDVLDVLVAANLDALAHQNDFYLPRDVVPRSYRLRLVPRPDQGEFSGAVWINVSCLQESESLTLHAHERLNTSSNRVALRRLPRLDTEESSQSVAVSSTKKNFAKQWYIIMLGEKLHKGAEYELHITFSGRLDDEASEGFFRGSYLDHRSQETSWYAATGMEATKARRVFPCFDEPALKATFQISVGCSRKYHVWSNMPLLDTENMSEEPGWLWHHFPATPPMSTFSLGVFVSDFHYVTVPTTSGGYIRLSSRPELLDNLEKINLLSTQAFNFAEEHLNISYPLEKLDVIVLPENSSDYSSDSWGLLMLREVDLEHPSRALVGGVLTQWIGHLTTPYWWSSIGIYSALISHLTAQFTGQSVNMAAGCTNSPVYNGHSSANVQPSSVTGYEQADRAVRLLRLLNYTLTESTFRQALHVFLEDRRYKTFTDHSLWAALTSQSRLDHTLEEDVSVEEVASSWMGKDSCPAVTVTRDYESGTATVQQHVFLRERPHDIPGKEKMLWYIPIMYVTAGGLNASEVRPVAWLKNDQQATIDGLPGEDEFIVLKPDDIGSFVANYDVANWALLSRALLEGELPTQTRAKVLHDAWNLAYGGWLDFDIALNMTLFLRDERSPDVWGVFLAMVDHLKRHLGGTEVETLFDEYARGLLDHCLRMLGPAEPSESREMRDAARGLQSILSQSPPEVSLEQAFKTWTDSADPQQYARTHGALLESVMTWGSLEQFQTVLYHALEMLHRGQVQESRDLLLSLARAAPRHPGKVDSLLSELLLANSSSSMTQITRSCLVQLSGYYNGSLAALVFLRDRWDDVRTRLDNNPEVWKALIRTATARLTTQEDLDMFSDFYIERRGNFGSAELLVEKELDRMKEDAVWTENNVPVIHRWLEDFLEKYTFPVEMQG